jgi:hypothetical protein
MREQEGETWRHTDRPVVTETDHPNVRRMDTSVLTHEKRERRNLNAIKNICIWLL